MKAVDTCSKFADEIKRLYVDECYNVPQTCEALAPQIVISRSTMVRFLQINGWYRSINPHPRDEKKRRTIVSLRPLIEEMYIEKQLSSRLVNIELAKLGHKFSDSMIRSYLEDWGVLRNLSESDAIRNLNPRECQACKTVFKPKSVQHQCCQVCSPDGWGYWTKFKLTPLMYASLVEKQHGLCALCPRVLADLPSKQVHLDHCHMTNRVRGVLCQRCNHCMHVVDLYPGWGTLADAYSKGS